MSDTWIPNIGELFLRQIVGLNCNHCDLLYRDDKSNPDSCSVIAVMTNFVAEAASFTSGIDNMSYSSGIHISTVPPLVFVRRSASDTDLQAFFKLWNHPQRLSSSAWLHKVLSETKLLMGEKERLRRIALTVRLYK